MEKFVDYYKVLQVHQEADHRMIENAYRCLSKQYHPDVNKELNAKEHMTEINLAYAVLGNEKKRQAYHRKWLIKGIRRITPEVRQESQNAYKIDLAQSLLEEFFQNMIVENWSCAYTKLTTIDKLNVTEQEFSDWKEAVSKLYKLANYEITFNEIHINCEYADRIFSEVIQFEIQLTIMDIATGKMNKETTKKYVAYAGSSWNLCLGYSSLKPLIEKFQFLAKDKNKKFKKQNSGVVYYFDMLQQGERELLRSRRYGNPLCLIMFTVHSNPGNKVIAYESYKQKCVQYVSKILFEKLRKTDLIGRYHESSFAIFLTETSIDEGKLVIEKLQKEIARPRNLSYKIFGTITDCRGKTDIEGILKAAFEKTAPKEVKSELTYFL